MTIPSAHAPNGAPRAVSWLRNAGLADGRVVDVAIDATTGTIVAVDEPRRAWPRGSEIGGVIDPNGGAGVTTDIDLEGWMLLPAPAEPHAHLDKALTVSELPNLKGDLLGAIEAWMPIIPRLTVADMAERAETAARELLASGVTAVRTHVNIHEGIDTKAAEALLLVRSRIGHLMDIEIVALCGWVTGPDTTLTRSLIRAALEMDESMVVGGCPHLDVEPLEASDFALDLAMELGRQLDLHTDETLNGAHLELRYLAQRVRETGFDLGTTASHCVSLGVQPFDVQQAVAAEVAAAGVRVITLPQTNLFLQGREHPVSTPRGLTALRPLLAAGATLGAGADNVRDPFNSMGRSDPFETAALLVMAGHLLPDEAFHAVSSGARASMGFVAGRIEVGHPAELLAVPGDDLTVVIAKADAQRMVWHRGVLVSSTKVERSVLR
jgi:cytosine/creatinine deaminase